jgi:hypothetical protein
MAIQKKIEWPLIFLIKTVLSQSFDSEPVEVGITRVVKPAVALAEDTDLRSYPFAFPGYKWIAQYAKFLTVQAVAKSTGGFVFMEV